MDTRSAALAIVEAVQGSKLRLKVGFDGRAQVLPQRLITLLSPLPGGVDPPSRLGALPWELNEATLAAARAPRRAWGEAWLLLLEADEPVSLAEFCELVCAGAAPNQLAACWLELVGGQSWFRIRHTEISARPLTDLRTLRRERRRGELEDQREQRWLALLRARQPVQADDLDPDQRQRLEQLAELASGRLEASDLEPALRQGLSALHIGLERGDLRHLLQQLLIAPVGGQGLAQGGTELGFLQVEHLLVVEFRQLAVGANAPSEQLQLGVAVLLLLARQGPLVHRQGAGEGLHRAEQPLLQVGDHQPVGGEEPLQGRLGGCTLGKDAALPLLAVLLQQAREGQLRGVRCQRSPGDPQRFDDPLQIGRAHV